MAGEQGYKAGFASPRVAPAPVSTQTPSGAEQPWSPVHSAVMQFDEQHEAATAGTLRDSEGNVVIMRTNFWWSARGMDALYLVPPGRGGRELGASDTTKVSTCGCTFGGPRRPPASPKRSAQGTVPTGHSIVHKPPELVVPADRDVGDPPLASAEFLVDGPPLADEFDNHAHHDPGAYAGQGMGAGESRRPMSAVSGRSFDHVYHGARKHSADAVLSGARRGMFTEGLDVSEALPEPDIAAPSRRGSLAFQIDVVGGSDDDGRDGAGVGVGVGAGAGMGAGAGAGTGAGLGAVEAPHKLDQRDTIYVDQGSSEASDHAQETQHDQWHHEPHLLHPHHHHHSMATTAAGSDPLSRERAALRREREHLSRQRQQVAAAAERAKHAEEMAAQRTELASQREELARLRSTIEASMSFRSLLGGSGVAPAGLGSPASVQHVGAHLMSPGSFMAGGGAGGGGAAALAGMGASTHSLFGGGASPGTRDSPAGFNGGFPGDMQQAQMLQQQLLIQQQQQQQQQQQGMARASFSGGSSIGAPGGGMMNPLGVGEGSMASISAPASRKPSHAGSNSGASAVAAAAEANKPVELKVAQQQQREALRRANEADRAFNAANRRLAAREEAAAAAHATAEEAAEDLEARGLLDQFARFTVPPSPPVASAVEAFFRVLDCKVVPWTDVFERTHDKNFLPHLREFTRTLRPGTYVAKKVRQLLAEPGVNATVIKPTCAPAAPMAIWVSAVVSFLDTHAGMKAVKKDVELSAKTQHVAAQALARADIVLKAEEDRLRRLMGGGGDSD